MGTKQFEGRSEEEAVERASEELGIGSSELDYVVVDEGSGGVFGLGARPVQIRVRDQDDEVESGDAADEPDDEGPESGVVSDDSLDEGRGGVVGPAPEKAAQALEVAQALATKMGLTKAQVSVRDEHAEIVISIADEEGESDVADVFGKSRPPAIPSFQFLLNKIVNRFPDDRKHIVVEVPSVPRRERRAEVEAPSSTRSRAVELDPDLDPEIVALARLLAERSSVLQRVICVHPMLAADRRAMHQTITAIDGVSTVSEGEGLYRRLHIVPDGLSGGGKKRRRRRRRRGKRPGEGDELQDGQA